MSMYAIRHRNAAIGHHFFSADTMDFFGSRVEAGPFRDGIFITSEQPPHGPRAYAIRKALPRGEIVTYGGSPHGVCRYATREAAIADAKALAAGDTPWKEGTVGAG